MQKKQVAELGQKILEQLQKENEKHEDTKYYIKFKIQIETGKN